MPQNQTTNQSSNTQDGSYTAIDPQKDPIAFVMQNQKALGRMPPEKAVKFVDMMFRRYALPKYQQANQQRPLDEEEVSRLRLSFAARMFGIPSEPVNLKDPKVEHGALDKAGAALEAGGAGVIGGIKTIAELQKKINDHLGPIGKPENYLLNKIIPQAGKAEGKAYSDAQEVSPGIASTSAAIGHQIPSTIAAAGAGGVIPKLAAGAPTALKVAAGGAKGIVEGGAFEAARPGGDPQSGAIWGGVLGAAFPILGKLFGLGKKAATSVATEIPKTGTTLATTTETSKSLGDVANATAKEKFGKSFKDLTPTEKAQMPSLMKEEIAKQQVQKTAKKKAEQAVAKAGREADETAKRKLKADAAQEKAATQAVNRSETTTPVQKQAVAAKAAEENPSIAKALGTVVKGEEAMPMAAAEKTALEKRIGRTLSDTEAIQYRKKVAEWESNNALKAGKVDVAAKETAGLKDKKPAPSLNEVKQGLAEPYLSPKEIKKIPEGETGKKVRAKDGQPASPAQQKADAERIAAKRAESKQEEFGAALEKHAQEMAGRHTTTSLGTLPIPELEAAAKEMPGSDIVLRGLQKLRRSGKISDAIYADSIKEWMLNQFAEGKD